MHVFLATDGSAYSQAAEALLAEFPFARPPQVTVVNVCPAADLHYLESAVTGPVTAMLDRCREEAHALLNRSADACRPWASTVTTELLDGHPADELLNAVERLRPDVVAIGARGLGAVRRVLLGSVSERLAKHAPASVLVAHPPSGRVGVQSIVVSYDGSPAADAAIQRLQEFAPRAGQSIHLLGIVETVHVYGTEMVLEGTGGLEAERVRATERLAGVAAKLQRESLPVTYEVKTASDVAGCILDVAEARQADLIVVGSRGKSAWERFLLGSTTLRVLHQATCSVWVEKLPQAAS